jgi:hypothetical protein
MKKQKIEGIEELISWVKGFCAEVKKVGVQDFACEALTIGFIYGYAVCNGASKKTTDRVRCILRRNAISPDQILRLSQKPHQTPAGRLGTR